MFTDENTEGYTSEELEIMNKELKIKMVGYDINCFDYDEYLQLESGRILKNHSR